MVNLKQLIKDITTHLFTSLVHNGIKNMPDSLAKGIENKKRLLTCAKLIDEAIEVAENGVVSDTELTLKNVVGYAKALQTNPDLSTDDYLKQVVTNQPYEVSVAVYKESHQTTYHVYLKNNEMVKQNESPLDEHGKIIAYSTPNPDHANVEAKVWAEFLGVTFTPIEVSKK